MVWSNFLTTNLIRTSRQEREGLLGTALAPSIDQYHEYNSLQFLGRLNLSTDFPGVTKPYDLKLNANGPRAGIGTRLSRGDIT